MRIRHLVCTDNFAGVERYVATTAAELARRGHRVEVFGGRPDAMRAALGDAPVELIDAPDAMTAWRIALSRWRRQPDLVHAHMTAADVAAVLTLPVTRAPTVSTQHFAQRRGHDALTRRVYSIIPRLVTQEIAISRYVATHADGHPEVILNGVPDPLSPPEQPPARRDPVVLVAQRLEREKDTATAIEAFASSALADRGWRLHVAGEGSERAALEHRASALGIAAQVSFLGRVADLSDRMQRAGLFLATAPAEPFGLSVVEAMAASLPVVAADGGAHRETIGSATPETLFAPGDPAAAGALLSRYAEDPTARADLAARGRARYAESFTIEAHVDILQRLYERLVTARRR